MKIAANTVVEFWYDLEVEGQIVDKTTKERPLDYIHGTGGLLPKLEAHIEGMEPGDKFDVTLAPADAYGELDPENYILMPKSAFMINGEMRDDLMVVGTVVPLVNQMGGVTPGTILEVLEDVVKIDINHQMAGKTLHFTGEILTVREASRTVRISPVKWSVLPAIWWLMSILTTSSRTSRMVPGVTPPIWFTRGTTVPTTMRSSLISPLIMNADFGMRM